MKNKPVTHGFFVFDITGDEPTVAKRKLDDTWGMTSREPLRKAANTPWVERS